MSALDDVRARLAGAMAMLTQKMGAEHEARREADVGTCGPILQEHRDRAVDFAVLQRQQAAAEVTDLLADALAEFGAEIDTLRADMARDRSERAAGAALTAKWRSAMDRKLEQVGGSAMAAAGIAAAHDHEGD